MTDTIISPATEDQNDSAPVAHSDLKALREAKGLSLQDIFESTRISVTNLKAIENAQYQLLPAPVFARTFIRSYAGVIGAESEILLASYEKYLKSVNAPPAQEKETGRAWLKPGGHGKRIGWLVSAAMAVIVVTFLVYYNRPGPEIAATPTAPPVQMAPDMKPAVQPEIPKPVSEKKYHLFMEASEPVWIRILEDGNRSEQMILQAGETLERFVDEPFTLDIGNAGGIAITFQGKSIGNVGKRGQVVHLRLPEE
jgi:cytoskeleton protein RodZ